MRSSLAPIVLFVYNRPVHTQNLLNSLAANAEAKDSELYVFCDGAKENATSDILQKIKDTRFIITSETRFKKIHIKEQVENRGLANSIVGGLNEVFKMHESIIVLEDDLILSSNFLYYMNDSLNRYKNTKNVAQIGSCNFFACGPKYPTTFFLPVMDCSGWATWRDRWAHFNSDAEVLYNELKQRNLEFKFNIYESSDLMGMLKMQIDSKIDSWAIRWHAVCILNNWLTLYPNPSFTNHIGSIEATHHSTNIVPPLCINQPELTTIEVVAIPSVIKAVKRGYSGQGDYFGNYKKNRIKVKAKQYVSKIFKLLGVKK